MIRSVGEYFRNNKVYVVILLAFLAVAIFTIIQERRTRKKILESGIYVIGEVVNIRKHRGTSIEYEYNFSGQKFHSSEGMHVDKEYVAARYLVKINPMAPFESRLLKDYFIADSLYLKQPDSGWGSNPFTTH